ncbi:MAG: hypothetical protein PUB69_02735 [Desulfovibrionaceae bacterium]|nr:hypothetical protein [Desulfovibrionaceae bacterium]
MKLQQPEKGLWRRAFRIRETMTQIRGVSNLINHQECRMSTFVEGLGDAWRTLFDDPKQHIDNVIAQILAEGGSRDCWKRMYDDGTEKLVMAWPAESAFRLGAVMKAEGGRHYRPVSCFPLLEGLPNDMTVESVYPWTSGAEAYVSARCNENAEPLQFYTPFFFRDESCLTEGVRHTFLVAGLAYGVRRALLDDLTITEGAQYEEFASKWLEHNPGKNRLDVPQLTVSLRGSRILSASDRVGEYQVRVPVTSVEPIKMGEDTVYMMIVEFGLNTPNPLRIPLYATDRVCLRGYVPQAGDEIDAIVWLQGRITD